MRVEKLDPTNATRYIGKAREFFRTMEHAASKGDWDAVGLNGMHCVISCLDAVTTAHSGERSRSRDHLDVLDLVADLPLMSRALSR